LSCKKITPQPCLSNNQQRHIPSYVVCTINLLHNWVAELRDKGVVKAVKVHTDKNVADLFTKCHEWHKMRKQLKIFNLDVEPKLFFRGHLGKWLPGLNHLVNYL
jgi:hypothetical protein